VENLRGEPGPADTYIRESLPLFGEVGNRRGLASGLSNLASTARGLGADERAVRLYAAAESLRQAIGITWFPRQQARIDADLAAARVRLGEIAFAMAWDEGRAMSPEQAVAYALDEPSSD
jgi:hypothetical protein